MGPPIYISSFPTSCPIGPFFPDFPWKKIPTVKITKWAPRDLGVWFYDDVGFRIKMCQGATQNKNLTDETTNTPKPIK